MGITVASELQRLRAIGNSARRIFSIINTEYFLAKFTTMEREQFWLGLWSDFPHVTGIVLFTVLNTPAFLPDKLEDLDAVFRQITAELQAQYLLGYYSSDERTDGGYRRINVRVAKRSDLRVRARKGYYAPKA